MENKIRFAFAMDTDRMFVKGHFGSAHHFAIYELNSEGFYFLYNKENVTQNMDEGSLHGLVKKGETIAESLKELDVKVLISRQFGKNISIINKYFIPVLIDEENPEEAISILMTYHKWLKDELASRDSGYKLFTIKNGIMKSTIKQEGE